MVSRIYVYSITQGFINRAVCNLWLSFSDVDNPFIFYYVTGDIPLNKHIREGCDSGKPILVTDPNCPEVRLRVLILIKFLSSKGYSSLFSLGLRCHTVIDLNKVHDCQICLYVHPVRINIWQYSWHFTHLSWHFILFNTKTAFLKCLNIWSV